MKRALAQHVLGVGGQIAAALPPVVILIVLARGHGLQSAGEFAVVAGISAATFSAAFWGLRPLIIRDRFRKFSLHSCVVARLLALGLAGAVVLTIASAMETHLAPVIALVFFKICDGLTDIHTAALQVERGTQRAIAEYAIQHGGKLILLVTALGLSGFSTSGSGAFVVAGIVSALFVGTRVLSHARSVGGDGGINPAVIGRLYLASTWFATAVAACALLTGAPRISLEWLYHGDDLGVVGTTLSICTFFGMVFNTSWVRHFPRFSATTSLARAARCYLRELVFIAPAIIIASWYVLPYLAAWLFDYESQAYLVKSRSVLLAGVFFYFGVAICNVYKATLRPWMETVSYLVALVAAILIAVLVPDAREIENLLPVATACLLILGGLPIISVSPFSTKTDGTP